MRIGRAVRCAAVIVFVLVVSTATASAATFYVNQRAGLDTNPCSKAATCETIQHAIAKAETVTGPNTIEVEDEGVYEGQTITLNKASDKGLTINAEHGVVLNTKSGAIVIVGPAPESVKLTGFQFADSSGTSPAIEVGRGGLVLENIEMTDDSGSGNLIEVVEGSSLKMTNSKIEMEGTGAFAVAGLEGSELTLEGDKILNGLASSDESGGVEAKESKLTMSNSTIALESGSPGIKAAVNVEKAPSVSLQNDLVKQSDLNANGVLIKSAPLTVNGLTIEMQNGTSKQLGFGFLNSVGASTLSHLKVSGNWVGIGAIVLASQPTTITDSNIATNAASSAPAVAYTGSKGGSGLLLQRSVLSSAKTAEASMVVEGSTEGTNATLDSSEVLGGLDGIKFEQKTSGTSTLTVSASTIDANVPGTAADAPGVNGIYTQASTKAEATANVVIQGSIVLEKQTASVEAGDAASVTCSNSAIPSQAQAAGSGNGAIACTSGSSGNTEVSPLSSLFAEPLTSYALVASSPAHDSVPAAAIPLPFGLTPSATDLAGNARTATICSSAPVQDKGALQSPTGPAACAPGGGSKPVGTAPNPTPSISGLSLSPSAFRAAPKGATISKAKSKYGAKISWKDSQAATTTFTVLVTVTGRRQGKSCKKPSKANKHGKRCTFLRALGTFTHTDKAGANSLHFSGRLHGRKLPPAGYTLRALARDAAGSGKAVTKGFKVL